MRRRLAVAIGALLVFAVVLPAAAYVRTTSERTGKPLFWRDPVGVPIVLNLNGFPLGRGCASAAQAIDLVKASLATWGQASRGGSVCTSFRFAYQGETTLQAVGFDQAAGATNENLLVMRRGLCSTNPACAGATTSTLLEACADRIGCWPHSTTGSDARTIAITLTSYDANTGEIFDADTEFHDRDAAASTGFWFTCPNVNQYCGVGVAPNGNCVATDLGSIVTHEAGHILGLDHPPSPASATMYATYVPGSTGQRTLDPDDVNGVCDVYPATGSSSSGSTPSSGGCSTAGGGVISMMGVALALSRRRRSASAPRDSRGRQDTTTPA